MRRKLCSMHACADNTSFVSIKDIALMSILTVGFLILALFRLGSSHVPETEMTFSSSVEGMKDVVLDFGDTVKVSEVKIFLGYKGLRKVSVSVPYGGAWKVISDEAELKSAYAWNSLKIGYELKHLGIVFLDEETRVLEMVCLDEESNQILPENASDYGALFDDQEFYVENPTYFNQTMFDEVYHGRTAYEFLHHLSIYENTHPPLGKSLISIGIAWFGMNPFGWRFICVICGSLMIPVIYLFGLRMTGKTKYAFLAAVLLATEFMHFTLSRIATIDVIVALFILCMFYFMYSFTQTEKRRYLLCTGIASGLAISTKWTGFYALAGLAILFFVWMAGKWKTIPYEKENKKYWWRLCGQCVIYFIVIPVIIYIMSYIPFERVYTDQNLLEHVVSNGKLMLNYHVDTVFEHPYQSPWYTWLVDWRPLIDSRTRFPDGKVSVVATFGNPLVYFGGLLALAWEIRLCFKKNSAAARTLVIAYGALLIPWLFIHRTVFIYQYFTCSQVLILMICHSISSFYSKWENQILVTAGIVSVGLFILFYPVLSGTAIDSEYISRALTWFPDWNFI